MSTSQFPPSSPVLGSDNEEIQPKGLLISAKASGPDTINASKLSLDYPTPAPSSSAGLLSSEPNFSENKENIPPSSPLKAKLPVKRSFSVRNPIPIANKRVEPVRNPSQSTLPSIIPRESFEEQVKRVSKVLRINTAKDSSVSVGRSSKKCQFGLNPHNKLISRVHCIVSFSKINQTVTLKCLGWNGLNVTIASRVSVLKSENSDHMYKVVVKTGTGSLVEEKTSQKEEQAEGKDKRVLFEDPSFTNFYILKGESVEMPIARDVVIDIRGEILMLAFERKNFKEDASSAVPMKPAKIAAKLTVNKENSKSSKMSTKEVKSEMKKAKLDVRKAKLDVKEAKPEVQKAKIDVKKAKPDAKNVVRQAEVQSITRPELEPVLRPITEPIVKAITKQAVSQLSKPTVKAIKPTHKLTSKLVIKPAEITTRLAGKQEKTAKTGTRISEHHKRVRKSYIREEEEEEKYEFEHMNEEQIHKVLNQIPELEEVSHIVANHIAYSRLLQVPISQLLNLNPVKERSINRLQLRCILVHHLDFIGIIHRHGTDAAGLPLDEEYYYIPEKDEDKSRVRLVEELKGSASHLRSCRKTHKQYFWKRPKK